MKGNSISKILSAAAIVGLLAGTVVTSDASAKDKKQAKKEHAKGKKDHKCKGEKKDSCKGKDGCDGKDGCSAEEEPTEE